LWNDISLRGSGNAKKIFLDLNIIIAAFAPLRGKVTYRGAENVEKLFRLEFINRLIIQPGKGKPAGSAVYKPPR
jgi:hypothetical protein